MVQWISELLEELFWRALDKYHEFSWFDAPLSKSISWPNEFIMVKCRSAYYQLPIVRKNIFCLMSLILRDALAPLRAPTVTDIITSDMTILEFGCYHAPVYRSWRLFLNHKKSKWFLADIPNYGFHYARHMYGRDGKVRFVTIDADYFDDPLKGINDRFDIIIVQEVFEHLQKPRLIAEYLVDRLKPKGVFAFDYIKSDAKRLDTPTGLVEREETLSFLNETLAPFGMSELEDKEQSGLRLRVKRR